LWCGTATKGLGNCLTVWGLLDLQKSEKADILFLSEMKMDNKRMQWFRWTFGLVNMVVKDCEGKGELHYSVVEEGVDVTLRNYSQYHDMDIAEEDGKAQRFASVYGEAHVEHKEST
jgi:hypothetical protein